MPLKVPPPPPLAVNDPVLNRWLLELTAILNASGGIDPGSVVGLPEVIAQSAANATAITALQNTTGGQSSAILILQSEITTLTNGLAAANASITTLAARNQVLNGAGVPGAGLGSNGDLYLNNTGGAGTRLYGKIAAAWVAIA